MDGALTVGHLNIGLSQDWKDACSHIPSSVWTRSLHKFLISSQKQGQKMGPWLNTSHLTACQKYSVRQIASQGGQDLQQSSWCWESKMTHRVSRPATGVQTLYSHATTKLLYLTPNTNTHTPRSLQSIQGIEGGGQLKYHSCPKPSNGFILGKGDFGVCRVHKEHRKFPL